MWYCEKKFLNQLHDDLKKMLRTIFFESKFVSKRLTRETNRMYLSTELNIFEISKMFVKVIQQNCPVNTLRNLLFEKCPSKINTKKKLKNVAADASYRT